MCQCVCSFILYDLELGEMPADLKKMMISMGGNVGGRGGFGGAGGGMGGGVLLKQSNKAQVRGLVPSNPPPVITWQRVLYRYT
jgi:hypothetical protein